MLYYLLISVYVLVCLLLILVILLQQGKGGDIASAFGIRRSQAERMKCFYGAAMPSPRDNNDMVDIEAGDSGQPRRSRRSYTEAVPTGSCSF